RVLVEPSYYSPHNGGTVFHYIRCDAKALRASPPAIDRDALRRRRASALQRWNMTSKNNEPDSGHPTEEEIDETLDESFPASDPPSWTLGIDKAPEPKKPEEPAPRQ